MNGLAKTAWTKKLQRKAYEDFRDNSVDIFDENRLSSEEVERIMNYVKDNENLDVGVNMLPDNVVVANPFFARLTPNSFNKIKKKKNLDKNYQVIKNHYKGEKDGFINSMNTRSSLLHELGHAIDHKRNPMRGKWTSLGKTLSDPRASTALAAFNAATFLPYEAPFKPTEDGTKKEVGLTEAGLKGAALGASIGIPMSVAGGLLVNKSENEANRYGGQILRGTNTAKRTRELYPNFLRNLELAKKTYTTSALSTLKNVPLWAGTGAVAGLGLAGLTKELEKAYDRHEDEV